jgi:hypothetical protein
VKRGAHYSKDPDFPCRYNYCSLKVIFLYKTKKSMCRQGFLAQMFIQKTYLSVTTKISVKDYNPACCKQAA